MTRGREPAVGTTASGSVVSIQVVARGADAAARAEAEMAACVGDASPYAFGSEDSTLASALLEECRTRGRTLAVAESCTGGIVGGMLTEHLGWRSIFVFTTVLGIVSAVVVAKRRL
jgi:nicotinamide-nucleotide amidase